MKASTTLGFAVVLAMGAAAACSSDEPAANDSSGANTVTTTSAGPTTTGSGTTSTTATTTTTTATTTGTGGTSGTMTRPCDSLAEQSLDSTMAGVPGSIASYSYGDEVTTRCLEAPMPNDLCLYGVGADSDDGAGNMYANWGSGIGIQLADADENGVVSAPWDAAALGIDGVQFTLTGVTATAPVRLGIVLVSTDLIPYQDQGFVWGEDSMMDFTADGTYTVPFAEMFLPSWASYIMDEDAVADPTLLNFDASNIHSLQFQIVTAPGETRPYDFCVSNITWMGSGASTPVDVPVPTGDGSGGASSTVDSTGSTTTDGMGGSGMGGSGMGGSGMGGSGMGGSSMGGATTTDSTTSTMTDAAGGTMAAGGSGM